MQNAAKGLSRISRSRPGSRGFGDLAVEDQAGKVRPAGAQTLRRARGWRLRRKAAGTASRRDPPGASRGRSRPNRPPRGPTANPLARESFRRHRPDGPHAAPRRRGAKEGSSARVREESLHGDLAGEDREVGPGFREGRRRARSARWSGSTSRRSRCGSSARNEEGLAPERTTSALGRVIGPRRGSGHRRPPFRGAWSRRRGRSSPPLRPDPQLFAQRGRSVRRKHSGREREGSIAATGRGRPRGPCTPPRAWRGGFARPRPLGARRCRQRLEDDERRPVVSAGIDRESALSDRRQDQARRQDLAGLLDPPQTREAGARQHDRVEAPLRQPRDPRVHVSPRLQHLQVRPRRQELGLPPRARRADARSAREAPREPGAAGDQDVARVLANGNRREGEPLGNAVGTSFMLCTAKSIRPSRRASSSSRVKSPFHSIGDPAAESRSPVVLTTISSTSAIPPATP